MTYNDHFAGMTLIRPYSTKKKLLTKKVEKKDIIKAQQ